MVFFFIILADSHWRVAEVPCTLRRWSRHPAAPAESRSAAEPSWSTWCRHEAGWRLEEAGSEIITSELRTHNQVSVHKYIIILICSVWAKHNAIPRKYKQKEDCGFIIKFHQLNPWAFSSSFFFIFFYLYFSSVIWLLSATVVLIINPKSYFGNCTKKDVLKEVTWRIHLPSWGETILDTSEESFFFSSTRFSISFIRFPISSVILAAVSLSALRTRGGGVTPEEAELHHTHHLYLPTATSEILLLFLSQLLRHDVLRSPRVLHKTKGEITV